MSAASLLIPLAVLLAGLACRELLAGGSEREGERNRSGGPGEQPDVRAGIPAWMGVLPLLGGRVAADRLARAGGAAGMSLRGLATARVACAALALCLILPLTGLFPGRSLPLILVAAAGCGLILPDLLLEWLAARRQRQIVERLPDAIDVLAIAAGGARSIRSALSELQRAGTGPLAGELAITVAELEAGRAIAAALADLRRRVPAAELAALTLAMERSARLGSPLVEELHRQTLGLRDEARRRVAERAARAAPKIQLVIALVLVPSVLLMVAAALAANTDRLLAF